MKDKFRIALANLVNGSLLGYEDVSVVPEYEKTIIDYVKSLEKEVEENQKFINNLLEILKEEV